MGSKMKPIKCWMIVGKMTGNSVNEPYRLRSSARAYRKQLTFPKHYRIARVEIREVKPR